MRRAHDDDGFVLATAIVILAIMMGLGLGLLLLTDSQQKASGHEQASETSFNVAEAALNAQIGQLSNSWPSSKELAFPTAGCTAANSTATPGCPTSETLNVGYPSESTTCPAGSPKDPWGSPLTNKWTTYVRDDVGESPYFNSSEESAASTPTYDANGNGKVWVRVVGVVQCKVVSLVALASEQLVTVPFPSSAISGNWFRTSNNGNKVIVNTKGKSSQAGGVSMRCNGFEGTAKEIKEQCEEWDEKHGQVSPNTTEVAANPSQTLTASQLADIKKAAQASGHYFATGHCPSSLAEATGTSVYIEGPCELSYTGGTGNSEKAPGFLVLVNGTFKLNGNAEFFGTVYAVNAQGSSGVVVEVHGNSNITGSINVDGNGGISFGSSHENLTYSNTAVEELKVFAGASATRNSFRVLPIDQ